MLSRLTVLGINHTTATVALRERVAFAPEQLVAALQAACRQTDLRELVVLSTCNRTELFYVSAAENAVIPAVAGREPDAAGETDAAARQLQQTLCWLAAYHQLESEAIRGSCYHFSAGAALEHMIRVASGIDSMVLGEPQILGQMKSAYAVAVEAGTVGAELGRVFPQVFALAKRVRTDTAIGENPVSVAYAAAALAGRIFDELTATRALLVGAGETIDLVARHLAQAGVGQIVVANRTLGRAHELAQRFAAEAVLLADIPSQLVNADIVISATGSQLPILGKGAVEHALRQRKHRPLLLIDLAVPRDIELQVGDLKDVYLYSIDDLRGVIAENLRGRRHEVRKADGIIAAGVRAVQGELRARAAVDTVKELRSRAEQLRDAEIEKALKALARGEAPPQVLAALARSLTNKLIHSPSIALKRVSAEEQPEVVRIARELLGLSARRGH